MDNQRHILPLINELEKELIDLGYSKFNLNVLPPVINRIYITMNLAKLVCNDMHVIDKSDLKWCKYYAHYNHFFDQDRLTKLNDLYFQLTEQMQSYFE